MFSSLLLHLQGTPMADVTIEFGVELARKRNARVRGVALLDTRRLSALASGTESAVYCNLELGRLDRLDQEQSAIRESLSKACLSAEVNFDVRKIKGDPFEVLPFESQFHDLVVTATPSPGDRVKAGHGLSAGEIVRLLARGVQPLCVLRASGQKVRRVLLVCDASAASARAVRHFANLCPFPEADHRVLAIDGQEPRAREVLREMVECVSWRLPSFENGWLCGAARRVLIPYDSKWSADLIVTGVTRPNPFLRPLLPEPVEQILRKTNMGLYLVA